MCDVREERGGEKGPQKRCVLPCPPRTQKASPHGHCRHQAGGTWGQPWGPQLATELTEGSTCMALSYDLACGFTWELLSTDHFRLFELPLKATSPRDVSTGEVNWLDRLGPIANSGTRHCGCSFHEGSWGWLLSNMLKSVITPKEDPWRKPESENLGDNPPPPSSSSCSSLRAPAWRGQRSTAASTHAPALKDAEPGS